METKRGKNKPRRNANHLTGRNNFRSRFNGFRSPFPERNRGRNRLGINLNEEIKGDDVYGGDELMEPIDNNFDEIGEPKGLNRKLMIGLTALVTFILTTYSIGQQGFLGEGIQEFIVGNGLATDPNINIEHCFNYIVQQLNEGILIGDIRYPGSDSTLNPGMQIINNPINDTHAWTSAGEDLVVCASDTIFSNNQVHSLPVKYIEAYAKTIQ